MAINRVAQYNTVQYSIVQYNCIDLISGFFLPYVADFQYLSFGFQEACYFLGAHSSGICMYLINVIRFN